MTTLAIIAGTSIHLSPPLRHAVVYPISLLWLFCEYSALLCISATQLNFLWTLWKNSNKVPIGLCMLYLLASFWQRYSSYFTLFTKKVTDIRLDILALSYNIVHHTEECQYIYIYNYNINNCRNVEIALITIDGCLSIPWMCYRKIL